jgi:integrase
MQAENGARRPMAGDDRQQSVGERRLSRALDFLFPIGERDPRQGQKKRDPFGMGTPQRIKDQPLQLCKKEPAMFPTPEATPSTTVNLTVKRRYLTEKEIERMMDCARKHSRHGHRDATMILVAYRHGLRASELCDLQWHQIELSEGRLHVHRVKNGTPSVHPIRGDEMRALRKLRRES